MGWNRGITAAKVTAAALPSAAAYRRGTEADTRHAQEEPEAWSSRAMAQAAKEGIYTSCLFSVPSAASSRNAPCGEGEEEVCGQAL